MCGNIVLANLKTVDKEGFRQTFDDNLKQRRFKLDRTLLQVRSGFSQ